MKQDGDPEISEVVITAGQHFERLAATSFEKRRQMGLESKTLAEGLFSEQIAIERFERILKVAICREPVSADCTWPAEVPESAVRTVEEWVNGTLGRRN